MEIEKKKNLFIVTSYQSSHCIIIYAMHRVDRLIEQCIVLNRNECQSKTEMNTNLFKIRKFNEWTKIIVIIDK